MDTNPKVSIIVPLFNCGGGAIIADLVTDVLNQTEQSWELILCNDGSSDNTLDVCKELKYLDSRIEVIDNEHKGVSTTRNSGIEKANGEWITFVDADDHLTGNFLESMLITANRYGGTVDMICCSYSILSNNRSEIFLYSDRCYRGKEEIRGLFQETDFLKRCSPWARLFRNDIIKKNNIKFNQKLSHSEDRLFVYNYLLFTSAIATCSGLGYIYESFSSGSLKHRIHPVDMLLLRQKEMVLAAKSVIETYEIDMTRSFHIVNNLMNLLLDGAQSISRKRLNEKETYNLLNQLVQTTFLINDVLSDKRIVGKVEGDKALSLLIAEKYGRFDNMQRRKDMILKIKQHLRRLIVKTESVSNYNDYIHNIN